MKKFLLVIATIATSLQLNAQVTYCAADVTGQNIYPAFFATPSHNVMWTGMQAMGGGNSKVFARTINAGASFTIGTLPETHDRGFSGMWAVDSNMAYAVLTDANSMHGGSMWKTTNGGASWTQKSTTEFTGGYANAIGFFGADTGVVIGDPLGGYWEIYTTTNGGTNWTRVAQANIPAVQPGETGLQSSIAVVGSKVWFGTNYGRVYYSNNKGLNWSVATVDGSYNITYVDMADASKGAAWRPNRDKVYLTTDGGQTWTPKPLSPTMLVDQVSAIRNVPGAYVFKTLGLGIFVTTNNFTTYTMIDNMHPVNGNLMKMYDATIGWTQAMLQDSSVIKIAGAVTSVHGIETSIKQLGLYPNPVTTGATLVSFDLEKSANVKMTLIDFTGKIVNTQLHAGNAGSNAVVLDCKMASPGVYVLKLDDGIGEIAAKLAIQ
jgi:photosystem II stability/assembly factor-like uncharacterized protein